MSNNNQAGIELANEMMCPNCWYRFPPDEVLYISGSVNLAGDPRLVNPNELRRFLPTRFTADGAAIDIEGEFCRDLACPQCHLFIPRVLLEKRPPLLLSIIGKSGSGKSVFLAAMMNELRQFVSTAFKIGMSEPHPPSNGLIHHYENILFGNRNPEALVQIPKTPRTEVEDDNLPPDHPFRVYRHVKSPEGQKAYPRPMFFQASPLKGHPFADRAVEKTRTLYLYDVAGEFFESQTVHNKQITQYMAYSAGIFFVFDPTQEPLFLRELSGKTKDPQVEERCRSDEPLTAQHTVLATANERVKSLLQQPVARPLDVPLIIIAAKYDAWDFMLEGNLPPIAKKGAGNKDDRYGQVGTLRTTMLEQKSEETRNLFLRYAPQLVTTAEQFSNNVYYVPVTSTGTPPKSDPPKQGYFFRVKDIKSRWASVPLLWMMARHIPNLVPYELTKKTPK